MARSRKPRARSSGFSQATRRAPNGSPPSSSRRSGEDAQRVRRTSRRLFALMLPRTRWPPLPLAGRGWGWGSQLVDTPRPTTMTPTPRADARDPPHKGEGRSALLALRPAARADPVPLGYIRLPISHSPSRSRGAVLRPGFAFWLRAPERGVAERRESSGACEAPVGLHVTRQARRLARRLASHNAGRPPPGAPPWRFWAPVPRFPHRHLRRIGHSELLASGS